MTTQMNLCPFGDFGRRGEKCQDVFNADEHQAVPNKPLTAEKVEEKRKRKASVLVSFREL